MEAHEREPLFDEVTVAFIGGGFAGLITGAKLHEAGVDDVRIIEKGGDFGGTWYWNRYPGAQCDTAAFVYLPLLEETGHMPSEKYTHAPEILEHSRRIGRQFDLYDNAVFSTEVTSLTWDDDARRWIIRTNRGDEMRARFVAMGPARCTARSCRASTASRPTWATASTRADGTTTTPAAILMAHRSTDCATSESASSAPAPPRCSAFLTSPERPRSCTCSSAHRRRSTCATTTTSTPTGSPRSSLAGKPSG